MRNAKWPLRLAIVLSAIWAIIVYSISYENGRLSGGTFAVVGLIPLGVLWGMGWVVAGVFSQRAERRKFVTPIVPAEHSFTTPLSAMPADASPAIQQSKVSVALWDNGKVKLLPVEKRSLESVDAFAGRGTK